MTLFSYYIRHRWRHCSDCTTLFATQLYFEWWKVRNLRFFLDDLTVFNFTFIPIRFPIKVLEAFLQHPSYYRSADPNIENVSILKPDPEFLSLSVDTFCLFYRFRVNHVYSIWRLRRCRPQRRKSSKSETRLRILKRYADTLLQSQSNNE